MRKGIDVSHHQGKINWKNVKKSGIEFAIIRTGYGLKNATQIDKRFKENIEEAKENGILVGAYHYSYAKSSIEASDEAKFCLEIIDGYDLDYPVCYDIEDKSILQYNKQTKTDMCIAFCSNIEIAGYYAMIYANKDWMMNKLDSDILLRKYDFWLAHYNLDVPSLSCGIWQYSNKGNVSGIEGYVDLDYSYKDYKNIIKNKNLNGLKNSGNASYKKVDFIEYIVKKNDTLWDIANKYYGNGSLYTKIKENNNLSTNIIFPGQVLKI